MQNFSANTQRAIGWMWFAIAALAEMLKTVGLPSQEAAGLPRELVAARVNH